MHYLLHHLRKEKKKEVIVLQACIEKETKKHKLNKQSYAIFFKYNLEAGLKYGPARGPALTGSLPYFSTKTAGPALLGFAWKRAGPLGQAHITGSNADFEDSHCCFYSCCIDIKDFKVANVYVH